MIINITACATDYIGHAVYSTHHHLEKSDIGNQKFFSAICDATLHQHTFSLQKKSQKLTEY
jgi:hypothetical protein